MTAPNGACCGPIGALNVHRDCPRTWDDGGRVRVCGCSETTCPCGQANAGIALQVRGNDVSERYPRDVKREPDRANESDSLARISTRPKGA